MQQQFIPIDILIDGYETGKVETIFINKNLIQCIIQENDDISIEMSNQQQYIIPNTNIQVFMDRFKQ